MCEVLWAIRGRAVPKWAHRMLVGLWTLIAYLAFRKWLTVHFTVGHEVFRRFENPVAFLPRGPRLLSKLYVNSFYAGLSVAPAVLSADWSFNCIKMLTFGMTDLRVLAPITLFTALAGVVTYSVLRLRSHRDALPLLAAAVWMVVTFLPSAGILIDPGTTIAERLLFMPSLGTCIAISLVLSRKVPRWVALIVVGTLLSVGTAHTMMRNTDWLGEAPLFIAAKKVCPTSVKV